MPKVQCLLRGGVAIIDLADRSLALLRNGKEAIAQLLGANTNRLSKSRGSFVLN